MSKSEVIKALKNSGKGQLKYDRYWDNQSNQEKGVLDTERFKLISNKTITISSERNDIQTISKESVGDNDTDHVDGDQRDERESEDNIEDQHKNESVNHDQKEAAIAGDKSESIVSNLKSEVDSDCLDVPVEAKVVENSLTLIEKSRQESVQEKIDKQTKEVTMFNRIVMEEAEEEMKLIRQKYLLATLKRLKSHKEEFEALVEEVNRRESELNAKQQTTYDDKMKEIEAKQKQLEQDHDKKLDQERRSRIESIRDETEKIIHEINGSMENHLNKLPPQEQHPIKQQFNYALSMLNKMDMILTNNLITSQDYNAVIEGKKEVDTINCNLVKFIEDIKQKESSNLSSPSAAVTTTTAAAAGNTVGSDGSGQEKSKENDPVISDLLGDLRGHVEEVTFKEYLKLQKFCCDHENSCQNFVNDAKFKSYRNDLQSFIRTLINTVSSGPVETIRQKASQLNSLFTKKSVYFQEKNIHCNGHPDALNFCLSFAAKTFISVGTKQVSSISKAAFPMGALIALIWSRFPIFGKLFLGYLQEKCPFVIPYYPKREKDESEINHLIANGYVFGRDGKTLESEESYVSRMRACIMIYAAVIQTNLSKGHPHNLKHGWKWLANILNLSPRPLVTPAVLQAFLLIISFKMSNYYGKQFTKLLLFIDSVYLPMIEKVTDQDTKRQTLVQLKLFIEQACQRIRSGRRLEEPDGYMRIIPDNF